MTKYLILGTAGHIDHGKTSLIQALTGTNTDRLPEEQKRGITIELGYARLDLEDFRFGIVDVPGHERFVRQMLAGATGMDLVMLIVAADDSIKRQTREHLDILRLLNLSHGVIVITKTDLVDAEWCELVDQEVRDLVAGTFLESAPIVHVSSKTGQGMDTLKQTLLDIAAAAYEKRHQSLLDQPFRMAIDRVFTSEGFGTIVTGSVVTGRAQVGDTVEIQPSGMTARIRGLQNHDTTAEWVERGQRAAINLTGVHHDEIKRGDEIATPGHLIPTTQLGVELRALPDLPRPIKDRMRVRLHIGTTEVAANLRLPPERRELPGGEHGVAVLFLAEPVVAVWGQPYVLRLETPVETLGGGRVLFPSRLQTSRPTQLEWKFLNELHSERESDRIEAAVFLLGFQAWAPTDLARLSGVAVTDQPLSALIENKTIVPVIISNERQLRVHRGRLDELSDLIVEQLTRLHRDHPLRLGHSMQDLQKRFDYLPTPDLFRNALKSLTDAKTVVANDGKVALAGHGPQLSKGERQLFDEIVKRVLDGGVVPDTPKQIADAAAKNKNSVPQLIKLAVDSDLFVQIDKEWVVHVETWRSMKERLRTAFAATPTMTVSDIKAVFDLSRKHAVPLCEFLDRVGVTRREGDQRRWCEPAKTA
jgi:selenocysteine-specific elongation factor